MSGAYMVCPRCKPMGTKVTTRDGRRLGFRPENLYVGYLVVEVRGIYKRPPSACPNCGAELEVRKWT